MEVRSLRPEIGYGMRIAVLCQRKPYARTLCFTCARRKHPMLHHGDHHDGPAANDCLWPKLPSQPCFYNPEVGGGVVDWLGPSAWLPGVWPGDEIFQQGSLARYSGCHTLQRKPVERLHSQLAASSSLQAEAVSRLRNLATQTRTKAVTNVTCNRYNSLFKLQLFHNTHTHINQHIYIYIYILYAL